MARTRKAAPNTSQIYVAYFRVSDEKQGISRLGLEAQRESAQRYLESVKGTVIEEFIEIETGKRFDIRPKLKAAIEACRKHKAILLIAKVDRLARRVSFIANLMDSAIEFTAIDMPQANRLTLHIMAAMAEYEGQAISDRTKAGLAQIKRQIAETGSHTVRRNGQEWTINKLGNPRWQESIQKARDARRPAPSVQEEIHATIRRRHAAGATLRAIAEELNTAGLKTPSGAQWHPSSVRAALQRAA